MTVSDRDRAFMRRIGAIKSATHDEVGSRHRALPLDERLRRSWALFLATGTSASGRAPSANDDPAPFYEAGDVMRKILEHLGLPTESPSLWAARPPPSAPHLFPDDAA